MGVFFTDRAIFDNGLWSDVVAFRLFFFLYGKAVYQKGGIDYHGVHLDRGQLLKSYRTLQKDLEYTENNAILQYSTATIQRAIQRLCDQERIKICTHKLGTLFTVCNYEEYQDLTNATKRSLEQPRNRHETGTKQEEEREERNTPPIIPPKGGRSRYPTYRDMPEPYNPDIAQRQREYREYLQQRDPRYNEYLQKILAPLQQELDINNLAWDAFIANLLFVGSESGILTFYHESAVWVMDHYHRAIENRLRSVNEKIKQVTITNHIPETAPP